MTKLFESVLALAPITIDSKTIELTRAQASNR